MGELDDRTWESLPEVVIGEILSNMGVFEAFEVSLVCKTWHQCFKQARHWLSFTITFEDSIQPNQLCQLRWLEMYGQFARAIDLHLNQSDVANRIAAIKAISLANQYANQLVKFRIRFTGDNPIFYSGQEFMDPLIQLFESSRIGSFKKLDFGKMPVMFTDEVFRPLLGAPHSATLSYINIQNQQLVCKISPEFMLDLVSHCRNVVDLRVFHSSLCDSAFRGLAESNRSPLRHLSILCQRQEKYTQMEISEESWETLVTKVPQLVVTLKFTHRCPDAIIRQVLKPQIPIRHLFLETYNTMHKELRFAGQHYHKTLQKLIVQSQPSVALDEELLKIAASAEQLREMHIMCILEQATIDAVLRTRPGLEQYTLKYMPDPHPWTSDAIMDRLFVPDW